MRRSILTLAVAAVLGGLLAADAQACHKKKRECAPACAPAPCPPPPCYQPVPCPPPPCPPPVCYEPAPCPPRKKSCCGGAGLFKRRHKHGCHAAAPVCYAAAPAPPCHGGY